MHALFADEASVRITCFVVVIVACAIAEVVWPRKGRVLSRLSRWPGNLGITVIDTIAVRIIAPAAATGIAVWVNGHGIGLFNWMSIPYWLAVLASFLILDLVIYFQHRVSHVVPMFWRFHRMHHTDLDLDVTSGSRFHPCEILVSIGVKAVAIVILGAPVVSVLIFEVVLSSTAMFNHSSIRIPIPVDRWLRLITVTPDMHRVHHSIHSEETDSNFGFNVPWWDRIFKTYTAQPRDGHDNMQLGLKEFREPGASRLDRLLLQPFRAPGSITNEN